MVLKEHYFDQEIKNTFSDFEVAPDPEVWDSIASRLPAKQNPIPLIPFWLKIAAGLAILLGTSVTAWLIFSTVPSKTVQVSEATDDIQEILVDEFAFVDIDKPTTIFKEESPSRKIFAATSATYSSVFQSDEGHLPQVDEAKPMQMHRLAFLKSNVFVTPKSFIDLQSASSFEAPSQELSSNLLALAPISDETTDDFSLGVYFAPQFSYRSINESFISSVPFNELESPLFTFSAGAFARFKVFERMSIQIGVEYNVIGQFLDKISSVQHQPYFPSFEVNPITGVGHPQTLLSSFGTISFTDETLVFVDNKGQRVKSSLDFFSSTNLRRMRKDDLGLSQQLTFIDIPVMIKLRLLDIKNASLSIRGGGGVGYLIQNQVFLGRNVFSSSIGKTQGLRKVSFFASGGMVLDFRLSNSLRFSIEPTFQKYLRSLFEESESFSPANPFKYSINSGVIIDF